MPKITRADGPSYVDENGDPQQGPVGMVVEPAAAGDSVEETRTDEHGETSTSTTDYDAQRAAGETPDYVGNVSADGKRDTDASPGDGQFRDFPDERYPRGQAGQFDPGAHGRDDVLAYLDSVGDDERVRVLNAEANGKNRSTITTSKYANAATDEQRSEQTAAGEQQDGSAFTFGDDEQQQG